MGSTEQLREPSREEFAGFLSLLSFQWISPLIRKAYKFSLKSTDIWTINSGRDINQLFQRFEWYFAERNNTKRTNTLIWALYKTFNKELSVGGILQLISSTSQIVAPFLLRYIIEHSSEPPNKGTAIAFVCLLIVIQCAQCLATNHMLYMCTVVGAQTRAILTNKIFIKSLERKSTRTRSLSHKSYTAVDKEQALPSSSSNAGEKGTENSPKDAISLMSNDTKSIEQVISVIHLLWALPLSIIVALVLLFINIGMSTLSGFACIIILVPILIHAMKSLVSFRLSINSYSDRRVSRLHEILQSMWFVKISAMETSFIDELQKIRKQERKYLNLSAVFKNAALSVSASLPVFASVASFATYAKTGHGFQPGPIFSSFALWNSLRFPLSIIPMVLGMAADATSSIKRVETFLLTPEEDDMIRYSDLSLFAITMEHANFSWMENGMNIQSDHQAEKSKTIDVALDISSGSTETLVAKSDYLRDITLSAQEGQLIGLAGPSGAGKSSLICALAGEMKLMKGKVSIKGKRSVCYQNPWLHATSIRENILFGNPMDQKWYERVIDACALREDIDMLPDLDRTYVGESGLRLSGGQKQRICLARAIYAKADVVLLDDCLSALDTTTRNHVLDFAICSLLKDSCTILATHDTSALEKCDKIILLDNLTIKALGSRDELTTDLKEVTEPKTLGRDSTEPGGFHTENRNHPQPNVATSSSRIDPESLHRTESTASKVAALTHFHYVGSLASPITILCLGLLLIVAQGSSILTGLWLSYWTSNRFNLSIDEYIGVYSGLGFAQALLTFIVGAVLTCLATQSSMVIFRRSLAAVIHSPMDFFVRTPLGEITSRLMDDTNLLDNNLPEAYRLFLTTLASLGSIFVLIISQVHYFAIVVVFICGLIFGLSVYYKASTRDLKHHEAIRRSRVLNIFTQTLAGCTTIRAYGRTAYFVTEFQQAVDEVTAAAFLALATQRWLCLRLDLISILLLLGTGLVVATGALDLSPSVAGLLLAYVLPITQILQILVRQLAEVEAYFVSFERSVEYTKLPPEESSPRNAEPPTWPESGNLVFQGVSMRYRATEPYILEGISLQVNHGEKIGIVGRTGAGKSSLIKLLCGIVKPSEGLITLDGIDITQISVPKLRSSMTYIPQDPTFFSGTVQSNLDPFSQFSEQQIVSALQEVGLHAKDSLTERGEKSQPSRSHTNLVPTTLISQNAQNLSAGQRQLLALARALLRNSKIVLCDEATSSVDNETDVMIQRTLSTAFDKATVLCIAHRLRTVLHYDRICVINGGKVVEMDTPLRLWESGGLFWRMCGEMGIQRQDVEEAMDHDTLSEYSLD